MVPWAPETCHIPLRIRQIVRSSVNSKRLDAGSVIFRLEQTRRTVAMTRILAPIDKRRATEPDWRRRPHMELGNSHASERQGRDHYGRCPRHGRSRGAAV